MRSRILFLLLFVINSICSFCYSQETTYNSYFGEKIILHKNNTFEFSFGFSITYYWTKGEWKTINDTIFFTPVVQYDTLTFMTNSGIYDFELAKSKFDKPRTLNKFDYYTEGDVSGGQTDRFLPQKLLLRNDKLYMLNIKNKPIKARVKSIALGVERKKPTYFFKTP